MTKAEVVLWVNLRSLRPIGARFRRQHPIGPYVADFAHLPTKLVIEVDGATHSTPEEMAHDERRTMYLRARGWHVRAEKHTSIRRCKVLLWRPG